MIITILNLKSFENPNIKSISNVFLMELVFTLCLNYNFLDKLHSFQILALTGVASSAVVQIILYITGRQIESFWKLYPCWLFIFFLGAVVKYLINRMHEKQEQSNHHEPVN